MTTLSTVTDSFEEEHASNVARFLINANRISCRGPWTLSGITQLSQQISALKWPHVEQVIINGAGITRMDSAGAYLLLKCIKQMQQKGVEVQLTHFKPKYQSLLDFITVQADKISRLSKPPQPSNLLYQLGELATDKFVQISDFLAFFGEAVVIFLQSLRHPRRMQWNEILLAIDHTGYRALPLVGLLSFLIGLVLAYQMGLQLQLYGANIYIINLSGMSMLREFAPLMTAIIVAGRTSSSFTAQIGTMKVKDEVDALSTMGLSPMERIALPKIIGLFIALPLLTVWADIFGVLGSMVMAKGMLDISYSNFLVHFEKVIQVQTYLIGISKAPVFALIAATVGCYQGFQVHLSAESVGAHTTKSVVQSIFLIIIADAIFSVTFSWQGI